MREERRGGGKTQGADVLVYSHAHKADNLISALLTDLLTPSPSSPSPSLQALSCPHTRGAPPPQCPTPSSPSPRFYLRHLPAHEGGATSSAALADVVRHQLQQMERSLARRDATAQ